MDWAQFLRQFMERFKETREILLQRLFYKVYKAVSKILQFENVSSLRWFVFYMPEVRKQSHSDSIGKFINFNVLIF